MRVVCIALGLALGAASPVAGQTIEQRFERWFGPPAAAEGQARRPARQKRATGQARSPAVPPSAASVPTPTVRPEPADAATPDIPEESEREPASAPPFEPSTTGQTDHRAEPDAGPIAVPEKRPADQAERSETLDPAPDPDETPVDAGDEADDDKEPLTEPSADGKDEPRPKPAYTSPERARTVPEESAPEAPRSDVTPAMSVEAAHAIEDAELCEAELTARGAQFTVGASFADGSCGVLRPIALSRTSSGVALSPATQMLCRTALALDIWVAESVAAAARDELGEAAPTAIVHASTYVCRERASEEGISEHARGSAIDIGAFQWSGGRAAIAVEEQAPGSPEDRFLASVRRAACGPFSTVIGPGTDADHADHFHLDLAARRGGSTWCR